MYKRQFISLILLFILSLSAAASVLWRVSRSEDGPASYIFGTEHTLPGSIFPSQARTALDSCRAVVCEVDINEFALSAPYVAERMLMHGDSTLHDIFTPEQLDSIDAVFCSMLPSAMSITQIMKSARPAAITLQLQQLLSERIIGHHPGPGLDEAVQEIARASGNPVVGLETARFQIDLLFSEPIEEMAADLMDIVRDPKGACEQLAGITECYLAGDLQRLEDIMDSVTVSSTFSQALIGDRNRAWASQLQPIIDSIPVFIAVGAAHLPGPEGLIALLREAGYTVEERVCAFDTILTVFSR